MLSKRLDVMNKTQPQPPSLQDDVKGKHSASSAVKGLSDGDAIAAEDKDTGGQLYACGVG